MSGPLEYQPVPVASVAQPVRQRMTAPPFIATIGKLCVIVGVISIFSAVGWAVWSVWIYREADTAVKPISAFLAARSLTPTPQATQVRKRDFIRGFEALQPINPTRINLLDALLENAGEKLMGADKIAKINDHGRLPSNKGDQPQYFELKVGRVELYDTHALFRPAASGQTIRVTEEDIVASQLPSGLTPADLKAVMIKLRELGNRKLSTTQEQALRSLISSNSQTLIKNSRDAASQIQTVEADDDHAIIRTDSAWIDLKSDGTVIGSGSGTNKGSGSRSVSSLALVVACTISVVNLVLAIVLIVLGVFVLKQKLFARVWLLIFACIKLLVASAGFLAFAWIWSSFAGGLGVDSGMTATLFACWGLGFVFPIVLLIRLNNKQVREYYTLAE